jgi:hypothetical protein
MASVNQREHEIMGGPLHIETDGAPIKAWVKGVPIEEAARQQLFNIASLPFIHAHVAVMPTSTSARARRSARSLLPAVPSCLRPSASISAAA